MTDDPKERGICLHAFKAIEDFSTRLRRAHESLREGFNVYDTEAGELVAAANAALPFLDKRISEAVEDAVRAAEGLQIGIERGWIDDYAANTAIRAIALLVIEATFGVPDKKTKPAPVAAPKSAAQAADEIPF